MSSPLHAPPRQSILLLILAALALAGGGFWWAGQRQRAAAAPSVYVALGASDAVGVGADRPERDGWVPLVQAGLPPGTQLVNLGVSGATLGDVLAAQLPVVLDAHPRWVTIWPGVNDLRDGVALGTFAGQLDTLLGRLAGIPGATVVVLNIPDLRVLPAFAGVDHAQLDATVHQWNAVIADAARRHGALLVDLYAGWQELAAHPEYISADGFHPSSAGYRRIADFTLAALKEHERATSGAWRRV